MTPIAAVTLDDIRRAGQRIHGHVVRTPMQADPLLTGCLLKLEHRQTTGAFKDTICVDFTLIRLI